MKTENLLLGTITFGQQTDLDEVRKMVNLSLGAGMVEIDSAYVYNEGKCEEILGEVLADIPRGSYRIATKVNPRITGKLDREAIRMQQQESLRRLGIESSDVMYLHFPDPGTPLEETLEACQELYMEGSFSELGLSNFSAEDVAKIHEICDERGWIKPVVYEGVYNGLSRKAETELFSMLREKGMRFTAYNPLAGGLLTGKYKGFEDFPEEGRFKERASYKKRYWRQAYFDGVAIIREACEQNQVSMVEAALRWLAYHSMMDEAKGDGIIIGSSRSSQLKENIDCLKKGPLPESIVDAFGRAYELCREEAPEYYREPDKKK